MHTLAPLLSLALAVSSATAAHKGFNYANIHSDGSPKQQAAYETEFRTAKNLVGAPGFTSARLYTSIQGGTANSPIAAIPAAIAQDTSLLLGVWGSAGAPTIDSEIAAIKSAVHQFGHAFTSRVVGISVGSEDLYRDSVIGHQNHAGIGAGPEAIASYIHKVRRAVSGTALRSVPIGHVDTWTAWVNGSNQAVIDASDFIGFDAYPYFQSTMANSISNAKHLFNSALSKTRAAAGGKPVWVTETGWPVSGKTENQGVPSVKNAKTYWDEIGCGELFGKVNTWWYTLHDAEPQVPNPSFGVVGSRLSTKPLFDLSCSAKQSSMSPRVSAGSGSGSGSSSAGSDSSSAGSDSSSVGSGSGSGSGSAVSDSTGSGSGSGSTGSGSWSGSAGSGSGSGPKMPGWKSPSPPKGSSSGASAGASSSASAPVGSTTPSAHGSPSVSKRPRPSSTPLSSGVASSGSGSSGSSGSVGGGSGSGSGSGSGASSAMPSASPSQSAPVSTGAASGIAAPIMPIVAAIAALIAFV